MRIAFVLASTLLAVNAVVVDACSCEAAARPCKTSADCVAGETCSHSGSTDGVCKTATGEGEGEGEGGPGEGEGGPGEGEGEGAASVCGNGVLETGEACDDGNTNEKDACTSACTSTTVTVTPVLGVDAIASLPLFGANGIGGSVARGVAVAPGTGEIYFAPPGTNDFVRVDDDRPLERANLQGTSPFVVAVGPDESIVYFDGDQHLVHKLDPATGDDVVIAGTTAAVDVTDPPGFTFTDAFSMAFDSVTAIDVDDDGIVYIAGDRRVIAVVPVSNAAHVVAGSEQAETSGTQAQNFQFTAITSVSVEHDDNGHAVGLWLAAQSASNGLDPAHVDLASGALTFEHGAGNACDGAPLSGCQVQARVVLDDGAHGFFAIGPNAASTGAGDAGVLVHVDASSTVTTLAVDDELAFPTSTAIVSGDIASGDAVFGVTEVLQTQLALLTLAPSSSIAHVGVPVPSRGTDRTLFPIVAAAAGQISVYFATLADLWRADADGTLTHLAGPDDLGPCAPALFTSVAVDIDETELFFSDENAKRVCRFDLASRAVTTVATNVVGVRDIVYRNVANEIVALASAGVVRIPVTTGVATPIIPQPVSVASLGAEADDVIRVLLRDGSQTIIEPDNQTVSQAASSLGDVIGVLPFGTGDTVVFDPETHALVTLSDTSAVLATLAGNHTTAGFLDGQGTGAIFDDNVIGLTFFGNGTADDIYIVDTTSLRFLSSGVVTTVVGSDQFEEDGDFALARLGKTTSLSCVAHRCLAGDPAAKNVRVVDFDTQRVTHGAGNEGRPLANLVDATFLDDGRVVWSDGTALNVTDLAQPDAAPGQFMQGSFVGVPSLVTSIGAGTIAFFDGASLKTGPTSPATIGTPSSTPAAIAYDAARDVVVSVTSASPATVEFFAAHTGATPPASVTLDATLGSGRAVAVDDQSNVYVGCDAGIAEVYGATEATLVAIPSSPTLPFVATIGAMAIENGDVLVVDERTGALVRIAIH